MSLDLCETLTSKLSLDAPPSAEGMDLEKAPAFEQTLFSTLPDLFHNILGFFPYFDPSHNFNNMAEILRLEKAHYGEDYTVEGNRLFWKRLFKRVFPIFEKGNPVNPRERFLREYNYYKKKLGLMDDIYLLQALHDFKNLNLAIDQRDRFAKISAENGCPYGLAEVLKNPNIWIQHTGLFYRGMPDGIEKVIGLFYRGMPDGIEKLVLPSCLGDIEKIDNSELTDEVRSFLYLIMAISGHRAGLLRLSQRDKFRALQLASEYSSHLAVKMILDNAGFEISAQDKVTVLHAASGQNRHHSILELLTQCHKELSESDFSILMIRQLIRPDFQFCFELLILYGERIPPSSIGHMLVRAASCGEIKWVNVLLAQYRHSISIEDVRNAIFYARSCRPHNETVIEALLDFIPQSKLKPS